MAFQRRGCVRQEIHVAVLLIDAQQPVFGVVADDHPLAGSQRTQQLAVEIVQIQVLVARPSRAPHERGRLLEEMQVAVQLDPVRARLREQDLRAAARDVHLQQVEPLLVARLALDRQVLRIREPVDAREIAVAELQIDRRALPVASSSTFSSTWVLAVPAAG